MIEMLTAAFGRIQNELFQTVVQPLVFSLGGGNLLEDAFEATGWLMVGVIQLVLMGVLIAPLQRWRPVEVVTDRASVRVDVIYTLIDRLGLMRVAIFFLFDPLWSEVWGWLTVKGYSAVQLDRWLAPLWPGVTDSALASFVLYLLIFDLAAYVMHRLQHRWDWWWALHALHHSQRQMTMWTDNRNHLLDVLLWDMVMAQLGHLIGVPPGQFVAVVAMTQLLENLSHANVRLSFGAWGERLLVSPHFHRLHHSMGDGNEAGAQGMLGGHNFSILFPFWDLMFGTARFTPLYEATGVRDQLPEAGGRDYGQGFWSQQWLGLQRLADALRR